MGIEFAVVKQKVSTADTLDFTSSRLSAAPKALLFAYGAGQDDGVAADKWERSIGATDGTYQAHETTTIDNGTSSVQVDRRMGDGAVGLCDPAFSIADSLISHNSFLSNGWRGNHNLNGGTQGRQALAAMLGGSDVTVECGSITLSNGTNTKTLNNTSLTPNVIIFYCGGDDAAGGRGMFFTPSMGMVHFDGTTIVQRGWSMGEDNNSGTATPSQMLSDTTIARQDTSGAWHSTCTRVATGEFDVELYNNPGGDELFFIALQIDNANVALVDVNTPTTTGMHEETGPGFQPKAVIQALTMMDGFASEVTDARAGAFAFSAFNDTEEACLSWAHEDGVTTTNTQSMCHSRAVYYAADDGTLAFDASFSQFTANGWELNYATVDGTSRQGFALAIGEAGSPSATSVSVSEGASAGEAPSAIATSAPTLTDGAQSGEASAATATAIKAFTEAAKAGDTTTAMVTAVAALTEAAQSDDTDSTTSAMLKAIAEAAQANETTSAAAQAAIAITEAAQAGDSWVAEAQVLADFVAGGASGDQILAETIQLTSRAISEGGEAGAQFVAALSAIAEITEAATAGEAFVALVTTTQTITEGGTAGDQFAANVLETLLRGVTEGATAKDILMGDGIARAAVTEGAQAGSLFVALVTGIAAVSEPALAGDIPRGSVRGIGYLVPRAASITAALAGKPTIEAPLEQSSTEVRGKLSGDPDVKPEK